MSPAGSVARFTPEDVARLDGKAAPAASTNSTSRNGHSGPLVERASAVQSRSIRWAWTGRLAIGYLTVQTGKEGLGKSAFAAWMIARLTRGDLPGDLKDHPVSVLVVAGEDGIADTWKPRVDLAGADLDRVGFLRLDQLPVTWNVRDGITALRQAVTEADARVLFLDAALDHMPPPKAGESINSPTFVRSAFGPLKRATRELDIVTTFSMHPPKGRSADYRDLVQASQAFSAIPRVGLLFDYHPDDQADSDDRRRVLLRGKGNIGRDPGALQFRIDGRPYTHDDGCTEEREVVVDVTPCRVTIADLAPEKVIGAREPTKTQRAADIIRDHLADGTWHPAAPIITALAAHDLASDSVVKGATRTAGVEKRKQAGVRDGAWTWRLPTDAALTPSPPRARRPPNNDFLTPSPLEATPQAKASRRPENDTTEPKASRRRPPDGHRAHDAPAHTRKADVPPCTCAHPADPTDLTHDGRCPRCYGAPT